jgi:anaerobic magnesium-protoporphyrin IX monomethyl ester cyclase
MSMTVVFYNPPSSRNRKPVVPMSLLAVGAVLEGEFAYVIVDGNLEADPVAALDRAIRETGASVLAVTVMPGPQLSHAVPHCRELKARHPQLTIVWGGYFPTQHWEPCLRSGYVDYVVRGHAELAFRDLLRALASGGDADAIAGIARRNGAGEPHSHSLAPLPSPEELPDFPYHRIDVERYVRRTFMGRRTLPHHSSYGCPFLCNFCAVVNMVSGRWKAQSAARAARVACGLVERFGVDAVEFYDNNFFVQESRTAEFAERILDLRIAWWGESRIDTMLKYSERTWTLMRDSGLRMVFLGAESGSDETLRRMNKGGTASAAKTLEIARKMSDYGIVPEFSFVLGNPPDPEADVYATLDFIRRVKRVNPRAEIILYMYTPVPLSGELYEQARASGFRFPETLDGWVDPAWLEFSQRRSARVPWMSDPVRRRVRDFERVLNAYYPTSTDPRLGAIRRAVLRAASAWRYRLRFYSRPYELDLLHNLLPYQRPETAGF